MLRYTLKMYPQLRSSISSFEGCALHCTHAMAMTTNSRVEIAMSMTPKLQTTILGAMANMVFNSAPPPACLHVVANICFYFRTACTHTPRVCFPKFVVYLTACIFHLSIKSFKAFAQPSTSPPSSFSPPPPSPPFAVNLHLGLPFSSTPLFFSRCHVDF